MRGRGADRVGVMNGTSMKRHRHLATRSSVALLIGTTLVATAAPAAAAAPTNDDFVAATALTSTASGSVTGSNLDATHEVGEPADTRFASVWWSWTAPASGTYLFDTCGTTFESALVLYTGTSVADLSMTSTWAGDCWYEGWYYENDQVTLTATAGTTYYVQVGNSTGAMGDITLRWWPAVTPSNDDVSNATTITGGTGDTSGTTRFATAGADDLVLGSTQSVWFTWTPPATGVYVVDTCGSSYDTRIAAYTGTPGTETWTSVATNDDTCLLQSAITIDVTEVTTYFIAVGGYSDGDFGDFLLHWRAQAAPANDNFADATIIGSASGTATADATFATVETDEPVVSTSDASVWWRWTAPTTGLVVFDTCDSNFDAVFLTAYTGTSVTALTEVAGNSFGCFDQAMVQFLATSGTEYYIAVSDVESSAGDVVLRWQMGVSPTNDDFADAIALSGAGGTFQMSTLFATQEENETAAAGTPHTVWWTWLAPMDASVTFDTCGSSLPEQHLAVYVGDTLNALTEMASGLDNTCDYSGSAVTFSATAGQLYRVALGSEGMGDIVLHWPASGVVAAPTVTTNPQNDTVTAGSTAEFTAAASGLPVPTVQWQVLTTEVGATWTNIADATTATLEVATTYAMNGYQYRALFSSSEGTGTSDAATLTVNARAPQITLHPTERSVVADAQVTFTAAANGDPTPTVQWQVFTDGGTEWTDIAGATSTTLAFTAAYTDNQSVYRAVFTNPGGTATTWSALLTVSPNVTVTNLTATVVKGKVTVTFTPTGTPAPTYFQCEFTGKGSKGGWVACSSGDVFKVSAKYVSVHAGYSPTGPWGPSATATIGRATK